MIDIYINRKKYSVDGPTISAYGIRIYSGSLQSYDVWQGFPNRDDILIDDKVTLDLKGGETFHTAPKVIN